jgi:hypothetical protein
MAMRGILVVVAMLVAPLGCHSSMDRTDADLPDTVPSDSDPLEADPPETDPPDDGCIPIIGYPIDLERECYDTSIEIVMGCRVPPSTSMSEAACFVNDTTGLYVFRWDIPVELLSLGWTQVECVGFDYPDGWCE